MNPARAFGPQLVGDHWANWWVWYIGPFAGAVIAAALYELLYLRPQPPPVGTPDSGVDEPRPATRPAASSGRFPPRMLSTVALVVAGLSTANKIGLATVGFALRRLRADLVVGAAAAQPGLPRQAPRLVRGGLRRVLHRDDLGRPLLRPRAVGGSGEQTRRRPPPTAPTTTAPAATTTAPATATTTPDDGAGKPG